MGNSQIDATSDLGVWQEAAGGRVIGRGGGGIRTHGPLRVSGFQDRRNRPLCHPSMLLIHGEMVPVPEAFRKQEQFESDMSKDFSFQAKVSG